MTANSRQRIRKAHTIGNLVSKVILARVVAVSLFIDVSEKVERLNRDVSTSQAALQERPEVFHALSVNLSVYILLKVINELVLVLGKAQIPIELVGHELGTSLNKIAHSTVNGGILTISDDSRLNLTATLKCSDYYRLAMTALHSNGVAETAALCLVHVPRLAADERLIYFHFGTRPAKFHERLFLKYKPKALQHEPCRLLSDAQTSVNFHAGHTILAVHQHPETNHPLIEPESGILENGSELEAELLLALIAEPEFPRLEKRMLGLPATWTNDVAVGPAKALGVLESPVRVSEVNDSFLESIRCVHEQTIP